MTLAEGRETRESPSRMHINLFLARTDCGAPTELDSRV